MSYEIIQTEETGVIRFLHITSTSFRRWKIWRIQFHDGKETFMYRCGNQWMQWSKNYLDKPVLKAIEECIENSTIRNQLKSILTMLK
ncbi:hypothetical protein [Mucilaginibacter paludis]|uniref:Uncharacterized protein n=1 Tax=Mucilaginibacter paludis DSM 18603 TaxID=714943 RepID=H1Y8E2_9SPHI|nr:hypothetical protein [Mucilaginibacter paludis]EHQ24961.1 hypothetical protein Mucpa_0780 [Mucilaginibacter paludis DSM 18603]